MVIDSSALVAILLEETEGVLFTELISQERYRLVSATSFVETSIVIGSRYGPSGLEQLSALIQENEIAVVPFTKEQAEVASQAYFMYGKGRHPAKLNFGDCCSYALSKVVKQPLLFKGNDFSQTDTDCISY